MEFYKYEATANDFILIDARHSTMTMPEFAQVRSLCDRRRGIGADGVLFITATSQAADARMIVLNADGSRPEMCGNGLRCVAAFLSSQHKPFLASLKVETDAGILACEVEPTKFSHQSNVCTQIGKVSVKSTFKFLWNGTELNFFYIDVGNPHAVMFAPLNKAELEQIGIELQKYELFPQGVNVEQVMFDPSDVAHVDALVYERGVGQTYACGTGACAIAAALIAKGQRSFNQTTTICMPGGSLDVSINEDWNASLRGPARFVYRGQI